MPKVAKERVEPTREEIQEAARILKTKTSKKRERRAAAAIMSAAGSSKGGQNRARNLSAEQRSAIARMGGLARQKLAREKRAAQAGEAPAPA